MIRSSLHQFAIEALPSLGVTQAPARHHRLLMDSLEAVARKDIHRLLLTMPPGSAKSTYVSKLFPPYYMAKWPGSSIIGASNTAELAEAFSRDVQNVVRENANVLGFSLSRENASLWNTTALNQYRAAGVGGVVTGFRADLAIIDDPIKSREEADSQLIRDKTWNWFVADLRTRLKPKAGIVLVQTRWHEDDLAGRLLEQQPHLWHVLSLPATALDNDPLGRAPGELLWTDDPEYPYGEELAAALAEAKANNAMRDWYALYEQSPRPAAGSLFQTALLRCVDAAPVGGTIVRAWDLAATEQHGTRNPDWTVGEKLQRTPDGSFIVHDVVRLRGAPETVEQAIRATAERDGRSVRIGLPQDPGQAGKSQVRYLTRKLAGFVVDSSPESGDKATRAMPFIAQVNAGNVALLRGAWNAEFVDELAGFPSGTKDDQVDASSRAFSMLVAPPAPIRRRYIDHMGR